MDYQGTKYLYFVNGANQELLDDQEGNFQDIEYVRQYYAEHFPELATASYTVKPPKSDGGQREVIFAKQTGTKG